MFSKIGSCFFIVLPLILFSSVVDLIIALEADGYLSEFMSFYLKEGEPYLFTPYGTMICLWDGTVHYLLAVYILYRIATGGSYRTFGLFLCGSYINSLLVLLPGSVLGNIGVMWATLLNVPYVFMPMWVTFKLFQNRPPQLTQHIRKSSIFARPLDLFFLAYFLFAMYMDFFRGFMALGCEHEFITEYLHDHEPYIMHPNAYPKMQMIVNMVYYIPYYMCAIYALFNPGQAWLLDWALFFAGASAQGQFSHMMGANHFRTEAEYRVPSGTHSQQVFWALNIILAVVPQLFAFKVNSEYSKSGKITSKEE